MKFEKDSDNDWNLVTKNYKIYSNVSCHWWDLALPLHIDIDTWHSDYIEIRLHLLFFNIWFTRISHKYLLDLDKMMEKI